MKIERLEINKFSDFINFHSKSYPQRVNIWERFNFQFLKNPLLEDPQHPFIFIAYNQDQRIMGQYSVNPFKFYFQGKEQNCFCGCDLFVSEEYRKYGVGGLLSFKSINSCKPHISIGVSAEARPILEALKMSCIGEVHIFLWIRISSFPKFLLSPLQIKRDYSPLKDITKRFPPMVSFAGYPFYLISSLNDWSQPVSNKEIVEFSRDLNFVKWRFFTNKGYYLYQYTTPNASSSYFVVKEIHWRGLNLLALIDYRSNFDNPVLFKAIIKSLKSLTSKNSYDGVITLSSHQFFDASLRKENFLKIGSPYHIFTTSELSFSPEEIKRRDKIQITMADSDLEFAFWPRK